MIWCHVVFISPRFFSRVLFIPLLEDFRLFFFLGFWILIPLLWFSFNAVIFLDRFPLIIRPTALFLGFSLIFRYCFLPYWFNLSPYFFFIFLFDSTSFFFKFKFFIRFNFAFIYSFILLFCQNLWPVVLSAW